MFFLAEHHFILTRFQLDLRTPRTLEAINNKYIMNSTNQLYSV